MLAADGEGRGRDRSTALRVRVDLLSQMLCQATERLFRGDGLAQLILDHLVILHQITRASVPLMERALERSRVSGDETGAALAVYFEAHIEEERHHDLWTLEDLEAGGVSRESVLAAVPGPEVAALVGAQYYWIEHDHPVTLLGYIAVLEGNAPSSTFVDRMIVASGLPELVFRSHRLHAELDPGHEETLYRLVRELPLSDREERLMLNSALHTGQCLAALIEGRESWVQRWPQQAQREGRCR